jgi:hypothetical protein
MTETEPESSQSNEALEHATDLTKNFSEAIVQIRQRADYAAKGLAAIGTAAISAIGYTKLADVFPYGGPSWALWLLGFGAVAMIIAVVFLVRRFYGASESIVTQSDVDQTVETNNLNAAEQKTLALVYEETAELNGLETLRAYEARGQRFERIATRLPEPQAKVLNEQAQLIFAELTTTYARAAAFVLRGRSTQALFGPMTGVLIVLFVMGWYSVALSADAMQSKRADQIAVAKSCAEARKETDIVEGQLPDICGTVEADDEEEPTPGETSDQAIESMAMSLSTCKKAAAKAGDDAAPCAPIERALRAAIASAGE